MKDDGLYILSTFEFDPKVWPGTFNIFELFFEEEIEYIFIFVTII